MGPRRPRRLLRRVAAPLAILAVATSAHALQEPFRPVETGRASLVRRQDGCLPNFYSCADQGTAFANTCCPVGQLCRLDESNKPACCPSNAVCTGTAPATFVTPTAGPTAVSWVPNDYFSYPYIATSFANPGACSAAVSQCSRNYDSCTTELANGSGGGVTIIVPGKGGTTVAPKGNPAVGLASATSICSSLSSEACHGLRQEFCSNRGKSTEGFYVGTGAANVAARPTGACNGMGFAGVVAAGVGLGVMNGL